VIDPAAKMGATGAAFRPFHAWITVLAGLAFMGNGMNLSVVSFAVLGMRDEWHLSPADIGYILPMTGIGQLLGSIGVGSLADRLGRRLAFAMSGFLAGLGICLAALSTSPVWFAVFVFISGIGAGGIAPAAGALVSEFAPPAHRGRMMAWTQVFWVIGWSIAATLGGWFTQTLGWRGIMSVGGLSLLLGLVTWFVVPESPRFLFARGHDVRARKLAGELTDRHGVHIPLAAQRSPVQRLSLRRQLAAIWGPGLRRRTFALWTTWMAMNAVFQGPIYWLPVLLEGVGASNPLQLSAYVGYAMLPASFVAVLVIDRSGRRPLMIGSLSLAVFGALLAALSSSPLLIVLGGCALSAGALAAWPVALAWSSEQYPTHLRGTAAGWAAGVSRLGSTTAPLVVGQLLQVSGSHTVALLPFAVLLAAAVASVALFAAETANRTLEELTAPA
jgi:putative MFS transporter